MGRSPWGCSESGTTKRLTSTLTKQLSALHPGTHLPALAQA